MNIKKPKLNFQEVYVVKTWGEKIGKGVGVFFPSLQEGLCEYQDYWLVWIENKSMPQKIHTSDVFTDYEKAFKKLSDTKIDYINFLKKEIEKNTKKIKELQP